MEKSVWQYEDKDGKHQVTIGLLDWVAWEKHTGKSAGKPLDQISDVLYLCWHAAKRDGEKRPFDGWVARVTGFPEKVDGQVEGPTQPGA